MQTKIARSIGSQRKFSCETIGSQGAAETAYKMVEQLHLSCDPLLRLMSAFLV
jgi:hypothetical protein